MSNVTQSPPLAISPEPPPSPPQPPLAPSATPLWLIATRVLRGVLVFAFVAFHLVVLAIRNPLDLWDKEIRNKLRELPRRGHAAAADAAAEPDNYWNDDLFRQRYKKADRFTWRYTNTVGLEQRWVMFSPPMARKGDFLAVRLEFTDGSQEMLYSDNEPSDPGSYFRLGGWQVRKLEDQLLWPEEGVLEDKKNPERRMWESYARHSIRRWHLARPNDPRQLARGIFVRRRLYFLEPGQKSFQEVAPPYEKDFATFDANGDLLP